MDTTFTTGGQAKDGLSAGLTALMIRSKSSNWSQYTSPLFSFESFLIAAIEKNGCAWYINQYESADPCEPNFEQHLPAVVLQGRLQGREAHLTDLSRLL